MFRATREKLNYFYLPSAEDLFGDLTPESRFALDKISRTERFGTGVSIFSKGETPRAVFRLREGRAQLLLNDEAQEIRLTRLIGADEIFGLTEALADLAYETEAKTVMPCLCEFIERADFIYFLRGEPELCLRIARLLALRFQKNYRLFSLIN